MNAQLNFLKGLPEYRRYFQRKYRDSHAHYKYEDLNLGLAYAYASYWKNSKVQAIPHPDEDPKGFSAAYLSASYFMSSPLVPAYWISPELFGAITNTTIPSEYFHDLPIVHHKMALVLPKGILQTPFGTSVRALYWEHNERHPIFKLRMGKYTLNFSQESVALQQHCQLTHWQSLHIAALCDNFATYFELFPLNPDQLKQLDIECGDKASQFMTKLRSLLFQLLCLMTARPQLFTSNTVECRLPQNVSQRKLKRFYQKHQLIPPNWIGKDYRFLGQKNSSVEHRNSPERSHASPKSHIRRGHWRQQPCGAERMQRKLIWIEPAAVNF